MDITPGDLDKKKVDQILSGSSFDRSKNWRKSIFETALMDLMSS